MLTTIGSAYPKLIEQPIIPLSENISEYLKEYFALLSHASCDESFKESACNVGDLGSVPGLGRSLGEGNGYPLQHSGLENSMDKGAWWATVHGVTKSWTRLSDFTSFQYSTLHKTKKETLDLNHNSVSAKKRKTKTCRHGPLPDRMSHLGEPVVCTAAEDTLWSIVSTALPSCP